MELKELYILIVAFAVSGFISYKTFRWVIFEEIGPGLACLFLAFAVLAFLAITNYDFIRNWRFSHNMELNALKETVNDLNGKYIDKVNTEFQKQEALIKSLVNGLQKEAQTNNKLATKANRNADNAIQVARKTRIRSTRLHEAQAWALWDILTGEFFEIEHYLRRWEKQNSLVRENPPVCSKAELEKNLRLLEERLNLPDSIKDLYLKREEKYEILKKLRKSLAIYSSDFREVDFRMPPPPKLPLVTSGEQELPALSGSPESRKRLSGHQK